MRLGTEAPAVRRPGGVAAAVWAAPGPGTGAFPGLGPPTPAVFTGSLFPISPGTVSFGENPAFSSADKGWPCDCLQPCVFSGPFKSEHTSHKQGFVPRKSAWLGPFRAHTVPRSQSPGLDIIGKAVTAPVSLRVSA